MDPGIMVIALASVGLIAMADPPAPDAYAGTIAVEVRGNLAGLLFRDDPEAEAPKLVSAQVRAAGRELLLDCSECLPARKELVRRFANPGSSTVIMPEVIVKGRLIFRTAVHEDGKKEPNVPVVVVESLTVGVPAFLKK
jgi:hypothetical protein